jgi:hypothetical protein
MLIDYSRMEKLSDFVELCLLRSITNSVEERLGRFDSLWKQLEELEGSPSNALTREQINEIF